MKVWPEAAAEYERVLKDPYKFTLFSYAVQILDQFRLAGIYERLGQPARARHWYERFLETWKEADPDLQEVIEARQHLLGLTQRAGARE